MEKVAKWVAIIALFIIPFIPLYVESSLYFPFISGKGFAFRILVEIAFGAWALLCLIDAKYRPKFSWPAALLGILVVWMLIADLLAINPSKALWSNFERMDGWITLIHVFVLFVVMGAVFTEKIWKNWWRTFLAGSALVCSVGAMQLLGVFAINQSGTRVDSTFGNSIYLADYLLFAIALTAWQIFSAKKWWTRSLWLLLAAVEVVTLLYTETRGAFIGIFVASVVAALWWLIESRKKQSVKYIQRGAVAALALLILFGGSFFLARDSSFIQNNTSLHRLASIFSPDEFKVRFVIWDMAEHGAVERPFFGWGQEGFNYVFNKYYEPFMYEQEAWFDRAHNVYLDWLIAGGIPALLFFLTFLSALFFALAKSTFPKETRILLCSALLAYSISALSVFDNLFTYIPLLAIAAYVHSKVSIPIKRIEKMPTITTPTLQAAFALIVVLITATIIWLVNIPALIAGQTLIQALQVQPSGAEYNLTLFKRALAQNTFASQEIREQLVSYTSNIIRDPSVSNETKIAFAQFALSEMHASLVAAPNDARLHSMMASLYAMVGDSKDAMSEIDTALALSPKKQGLYVEKGTIALQFKDVQTAHTAFSTAYSFDSSFKDLAAYAAAGDIEAGDTAGGLALLQSTFGTTTVNHDAIIRAYYDTGRFEDLIATLRLRVLVDQGNVNDRFSLVLAIAASGQKEAALTELSAIEKDVPSAVTQAEQLRTQITAGTKAP